MSVLATTKKQKKPRKKYPPSSTQERRTIVYPTPQNEARLNKFISAFDGEKKCSKNEVINDALSYYLVNVHHVRVGI